MEFDEVSIVDVPANNESAIAISKSMEAGVEESGLDVYDADSFDDGLYSPETSTEVFPDELSDGDVVVDADGEEYVFVSEESFADEDFGKSFMGALKSGGTKVKGFLSRQKDAGMGKVNSRYGGKGNWDKKKIGTDAAIAGGGMAAGGAVGYGLAKKSYSEDDMDEEVGTGGGEEIVEKSLGDLLMEELSKASNEDERQQVIAAAMDEVEVAKAAAAEAWEAAEREREVRYEQAFVSKAAEYNVPVDPYVLGPILKSMAETLTDEQLDVLDQLFTAIGEDLYDEYGYEGGGDNASILDEVGAHAEELVGKADVSGAEAVAAVFEANPEAYEQYLAENGR